jgi:CubicO group peptidase (beta-lactamase class C family)
LIDKIGMNSMVVETDMAGNYVGSSYGWATTRDWAKFGLLYLHKGTGREQVFNESWIKYTTTPPIDLRDMEAFWLNAGGHFPDVPRDMYHCRFSRANGGDYSVA